MKQVAGFMSESFNYSFINFVQKYWLKNETKILLPEDDISSAVTSFGTIFVGIEKTA